MSWWESFTAWASVRTDSASRRPTSALRLYFAANAASSSLNSISAPLSVSLYRSNYTTFCQMYQGGLIQPTYNGCSEQFMRGNSKLMALAGCAYIGIYVFCADARPRTAVHLTRGFAACNAASTPWHEGRVRIPPMFRCLYICRDLRPASPRRRDRWSPSDARDTNRASPDTNIHECRLSIDIYLASRQGVRRSATDIHITIIATWLPIFVQPRRGVFVSRRRRAFVLAQRRKHAVLTAGRAIPRRPPSMIW